MSSPPSGLTGADFLRLLLLQREPGVGEELPRSLGGPLAAGELLQDPREVGQLICSVQTRRVHNWLDKYVHAFPNGLPVTIVGSTSCAHDINACISGSERS